VNLLRREKPGYNRIIKRNLTLNPLSPEWLAQKPTGKGVKFLEAHAKGTPGKEVLWKDTMLKGLSENVKEVTEIEPIKFEDIEQRMVYKLGKMEEERVVTSSVMPIRREEKPLSSSSSITFGPYDASLIYEDMDLGAEEAPQRDMENKVLDSIMGDLMEFAQGGE